ncbi:hypothetical protein HK098_000521 [Nowakowskiella sp. JEL0407]|nr:hypothetical protein HK098_000521 [Nowakowskiella sp. JEL0407]
MSSETLATRVMLYGSSVAGNIMVKKKQTRIENIFHARKVDFTFVDVAADEDAKVFMQTGSGKTTIPQIFVDGKYKGGAEELEDANEMEEVKAWLGIE